MKLIVTFYGPGFECKEMELHSEITISKMGIGEYSLLSPILSYSYDKRLSDEVETVKYFSVNAFL